MQSNKYTRTVGGGGRLFERGAYLAFGLLGVYSRGALIRGGRLFERALIRINTVFAVIIDMMERRTILKEQLRLKLPNLLVLVKKRVLHNRVADSN